MIWLESEKSSSPVCASLCFFFCLAQFDLWLDWNGLDTIVVAAGVSALQPLMAVAGVETVDGGFTPEEASREGIKRVTEVVAAATTGNYVGPLIAAVTFVSCHFEVGFSSSQRPDTPPVENIKVTSDHPRLIASLRNRSANPHYLRIH